jgi:hypothetical protein
MQFKLFSKILIVLAACGLVLAVGALFYGCAQVVPLSGGPKDTSAPKLLEAIPASSSLNFNSAGIVLRFNEYVQLKDLKNQLIVSPRLKTDPEITSDGKKILISIKREELLPNTTYRFYFGKAICDTKEGNPLSGYEYVFSTGNVIDTLRLNGTVTEAFSLKPAGDVLIGLYDWENNIDSLAYRNPPEYIAKSDAGGIFKFAYLPPKNFRVIAFSDKNKNLVYDGESEKIAFRSEELRLSSDSSIDLELFNEESGKLFVKKSMMPYFGKAIVIYNRKAVFRTEVMNEEKSWGIYEPGKGTEKDTLTLYYKDAKDTMTLMIHQPGGKKTDTLILAVPKLKINKRKSLQVNNNAGGGTLAWKMPLRLAFFNTIDSASCNFNKMQLVYKNDSGEVKEPAKVRFIEPMKLQLENKLKEGMSYRLKIDTACLYDWQGRYNDSMNISFRAQARTELGKITLNLLLNKKQAYIIQLMSEKEVVVKEEYVSLSLSSSNAATVDFTGVSPGAYKVKVIFDDNENKKWDSGNYLQGRQAEKVFIGQKQIKAMSDWDVEEQILVK